MRSFCKCSISWLLTVLLLLSLLPVSVYATEAGTGSTKPKFTATPALAVYDSDEEDYSIDKTGAEIKKGDIVAYKITVENNPGMNGFKLFLDYDKTQLTLIDMTKAKKFNEGVWLPMADIASMGVISWATSDDVSANGTVVTLYFTVTAAPGTVVGFPMRVDSCLNAAKEQLGGEPAYESFTVAGGETPDVPVTGVTLDRTDLTIKENETATLKATVLPENASQAVTWSASSGDIKVENGVITPTPGKTGTFTVTAAAGDKSASCTVTVTHGDLKPVAEKPVTCEEDGHPAYWFCDTCQRYYTDDSGAADKETSKDALTIPAGHQYGELIAKVEATCSMNGMKAHYECSRCKNLFDENKDETTKAALTIPATDAHNWGEATYTWKEDFSSCTGKVVCRECKKAESETTMKITQDVTTPASCMAEGVMTYTATFTDARFIQQTTTGPIGKAEHKLTETPAVKATCTKDGNEAYWTCSDCGKYFNTEREQINENSWVIKALGHQYGEPVWTWANDNQSATATFTCEREGCDKLDDFVKTLTATESSNTLSSEVTKKPTCTEKGTTTYSATVTLDGKPFKNSKDEDMPAVGHVMSKTEAKAATCEATGNNEYWTCSVCQGVFKDRWGKKETTVEKETLAALGHNFEGQPWQHDETGHWHKCSRCDVTDGVQKHVYGVNDCTQAADCACGFHKNAGEHIWNDPVYSWTGYTECTAERACKSCDVTENERAVAALTSTEPAACTTAGKKVYTATFTKAQFAAQTKEEPLAALGHEMTKIEAKAATCEETGNNAYWYCSRCDKYFSDAKGKTETTVERETLKALGHSYGQPVWTWADDGKTAEVKIVCANDKTHVLTADASVEAGTISSTVKVKPTCTAMGTTTYNATVSLNGKAYPATKDVQDIPMEPHKLVKTEAKAATCTETGNNDYWTCSVCKGVFKDEQGKVKTTVKAETLAVDPANHAGGTVERGAVAATCSMSGHEADTYCKSCGMLLQRGAVIPATGRHTYGSDGRCTVCGNTDPAAGVKADDVKASDTVDGKPVSKDNQGHIVTDGSGLVAKTEDPADESKVEAVKNALTNGSISMWVANDAEAVAAAEDGGVKALEALASGETDAQRKQELLQLTQMLKTMSGGRRNVQAQMVYDSELQLRDGNGVVAELVQIPNGMRVSLAISEELYQSLQGKTLCILRGSTDAAGKATAQELSATLGGSQGSRVVTFVTDRAGALLLTAYETTGGSYNGSDTVSAPRTADTGVTVWCALLGISALLGTALVTKKRRQA